jgi:hypothetical protein
MKILCLVIIALLIPLSLAQAQQRDSLIFQGFDVDHGAGMALIKIWDVTFDSVNSYDWTIQWSAPHGGISYAVSGAMYFPPLTSWDLARDSALYGLPRAIMFGICDMGGSSNPSLFTNGTRANIITFHFGIAPNTPPETVTVDLIGSIDFGFNPVIVGCNLVIRPLTGISEGDHFPRQFDVSQNYPNPFNAQTTIQYNLQGESDVNLTVYDLLGRHVETLIDGYQNAGPHQVVWNAENSPSGIYFYRLKADDVVETRRMLLLR